MPYVMTTGRWADTEKVRLLPDGSSGALVGTPKELGDRSTLRLTLTVNVVQDPVKLNVRVETAETIDGPWRPLGTFDVQAATGTVRRSFGGLDRWVRAGATVDGAGTVVFGLAGEAA